MLRKISKITTIRNMKKVTIIFYDDESLMLKHFVGRFPLSSATGRVILPDDFKEGKSIIAVCEGDVNIMNSVGDRIENYSQLGNFS